MPGKRPPFISKKPMAKPHRALEEEEDDDDVIFMSSYKRRRTDTPDPALSLTPVSQAEAKAKIEDDGTFQFSESDYESDENMDAFRKVQLLAQSRASLQEKKYNESESKLVSVLKLNNLEPEEETEACVTLAKLYLMRAEIYLKLGKYNYGGRACRKAVNKFSQLKEDVNPGTKLMAKIMDEAKENLDAAAYNAIFPKTLTKSDVELLRKEFGYFDVPVDDHGKVLRTEDDVNAAVDGILTIGDPKILKLLTLIWPSNAPVDGCNEMSLLHCAANIGNDRFTEELLKSGSDIHAVCRDGWTPLHYAAAQGAELTTRLLLQNGANPNAKNPIGETPLHAAARQGFEVTARELVNAGADINAVNATGIGALHEASSEHGAILLRYLIAKGAYVDVQEENGMTPLHLAIVEKDDAKVKILLKYGASLEIQNANGLNAMALAKKKEIKTMLASEKTRRDRAGTPRKY